jgi:hypothetical protein
VDQAAGAATGDAADPYQTDPRYCVYDEAYDNYLYKPAWVQRIVKEIGTVERYRAFFGREPRMKITRLSDRSSERADAMPADRPAS